MWTDGQPEGRTLGNITGVTDCEDNGVSRISLGESVCVEVSATLMSKYSCIEQAHSMFLCEQEGSQLIMIWVSDSTRFIVYYIPILWDLARNVLLSKESSISWDHFLVGTDSGVVIDGTESGTYVDGGEQWETLSLDL